MALLPNVASRALLPWRRTGAERVSRSLAALARADVVADGPADLWIDSRSDEHADRRRHVLLLAEADANGLAETVLPLLELHALGVTVCFGEASGAPTHRDLDRRLLRASQTLPVSIGIRGSVELERGDAPPELVYARLTTARRERERALQRPCEVYLFGGRRVHSAVLDLLPRCGFRLLVGRAAGGGPSVLEAVGVEKISAELDRRRR